LLRAFFFLARRTHSCTLVVLNPASNLMLPKLLIPFAVALCVHAPSFGVTQTSVTTDPVGFTAPSCLSQSDTYVGIPFTRPAEFNGAIQAISSNPANTLTVKSVPGWGSDQFVYAAGTQSKHYYVLLGSGGNFNPKEGHMFRVTGNGSNTLTVDTTIEDLSGVTANTRIALIPYWTPATIFPANDAGMSFTPTTSPPAYQTLLRIPDYSAAGIKQPYAAEYYFNNGSWRRVSDGDDHGDDPLLPDGYFVVRTANGAPTLALKMVGSVLMTKTAVPLSVVQTGKQDNAVAMIRPLAVPLDATGLAPIDNSFVQNDQLLLFNNARRQFDKAPYRTYTYKDGWRLASDPLVDHGKDMIPAGAAMIVRKAASPGAAVFWMNSPTYVTATNLLPLQATSRKTHAGAGTFDINMPIVGTKGIESRSGGTSGNHQIMLTFANNVSIAGANVSPGQNGSAGLAGPPIVNGKHITLTLAGVTNQQVVTLHFTGVSDGLVSSDFAIPIGILAGDTNVDQHVNVKDVNRTKAASGRAVNSTNFRSDVNVDGQINVNDVNFVKSFSGTSLP
jgi:uncharacterized protein (TIGR02597 family)